MGPAPDPYVAGLVVSEQIKVTDGSALVSSIVFLPLPSFFRRFFDKKAISFPPQKPANGHWYHSLVCKRWRCLDMTSSGREVHFNRMRHITGMTHLNIPDQRTTPSLIACVCEAFLPGE